MAKTAHQKFKASLKADVSSVAEPSAFFAPPVTPVTAALAAAPINGTPGDDELRGTELDDQISGLGGNDRLYGNGGDDVLDGGSGNDLLDGGTGSNTLNGGEGVDTIDYSDATTGIYIFDGGDDGQGGVYDWNGGPIFTEARDRFTGIENIIGSAFADRIAGSDEDNVITGGAGSDILFGDAIYGGDDILDVGAGPQTQYRGTVSRADIIKNQEQQIASRREALEIRTGAGGDFDLDGDENVLVPELPDISNPFIVPHATVRATGSGTADFYKIYLGTGPIVIDIDDNRLNDGSGRDLPLEIRVVGENGEFPETGFGNGSYEGYDPGNTAGASIRYMAAITTPGYYYVTVLRPLSQFDDVGIPVGSTYTLNVSTASAQVEYDGSTRQGYEYVSGGSSLSGSNDGAGNDTVTFRSAAAGVTVNLDEAVQDTGGAGRVQLRFIDNIEGSAFNDVLVGDAGDNRLIGGTGNDQLVAGSGNDTVSGDAGNDAIFGGAGFDTLAGGAGNDLIYGNENADTIDGGDGDDTIFGGKGADAITGGLGNDVIEGGSLLELVPLAKSDVVKTATQTLTYQDAILISTAAGGDFSTSYDAEIRRSLDVPHASISATVTSGGPVQNPEASSDAYDYYAIDLTAGATLTLDIDSSIRFFGIQLRDPNGNFTNAGGASYDRDPDAGDEDQFVVSYEITTSGRYYIQIAYLRTDFSDPNDPTNRPPSVGDTYRLNLSVTNAAVDFVQGADTIDGGFGRDTASYLLAPSGVTVDLTRTDAQDTGGGGFDRLVSIEDVSGSNFGDVLLGDAGANVFRGGLGADTLVGREGSDTLFGNEDADVLYGNQGEDALYGGKGADTLFGGKDNDILQGGLGADTLQGGLGADTFRYLMAADSTASDYDTITDFASDSDTLDLTGVRTGVADRFAISTDGIDTFVDVDLGGDGFNDMRIRLIGENALSASDIQWDAQSSERVSATGQPTLMTAGSWHNANMAVL